MSHPLAALASWLTDIPVQVEMTLSGTPHDQAAAVVQERRMVAKIARQQKAAAREREIAVRQHQKIVQQQAREQQIAHQKAYEERCALESRYRAIAIEAARREAWSIVCNLGFDNNWISAPWFEKERTERLKYSAALVEKYLAQILGQDSSGPLSQLQNSRGVFEAGFANTLSAQNAASGGAKTRANALLFED